MSNPTEDLKLPETALVSFIVQRKFIEEQLTIGHTMTAIWKALKNAKLIDMTYNHFRRLCNSQLGYRKRRPSKAPEQQQVSQESSAKPTGSAGRGPVANRPAEKKKFEPDMNMVGREFT